MKSEILVFGRTFGNILKKIMSEVPLFLPLCVLQALTEVAVSLSLLFFPSMIIDEAAG